MKRVQVIHGDITKVQVDVIVNAANERMLGGGGVDGAIHRVAGAELLAACRRVPEVAPGVRCPVGSARITEAFRLPARYVIHTVGPIWFGGRDDEEARLASCYRECVALLRHHGLRTIAFPAISCGVYRFPPERASVVAAEQLHRSLHGCDDVDAVYLVAFQKAMAEIMENALRPYWAACDDRRS